MNRGVLEGTNGRGMSKTVLVVEDNEDNSLIYQTILSHIGYRVVAAFDGVQALDAVRREVPDLVLLDISIPKVNGWDVATLLRADAVTADIKIVALTAHAYSQDLERGRQLGFIEYLIKPIEPRAVAAAVERIIGPPVGPTDALPAATPH